MAVPGAGRHAPTTEERDGTILDRLLTSPGRADRAADGWADESRAAREPLTSDVRRDECPGGDHVSAL